MFLQVGGHYEEGRGGFVWKLHGLYSKVVFWGCLRETSCSQNDQAVFRPGVSYSRSRDRLSESPNAGGA